MSTRPSTEQPSAVCPEAPHRAACSLIEDPTPPGRRRGPLAAGAITRGPEQQVSPSFSGSGVDGGYAPADLDSAYGLPSASAGAGQTVAVVDAYDDPKAESDLNTYRTEYNLGKCSSADGCFRKVNLSSEEDPSRAWAKEISLDLDMVSAVCPNCHILLVEAKGASTSDSPPPRTKRRRSAQPRSPTASPRPKFPIAPNAKPTTTPEFPSRRRPVTTATTTMNSPSPARAIRPPTPT